MSIELSHIQSGYPAFQLNKVSLTLRKGGFTALIGPNGCGKSTLLQTIAGQLDPKGGVVEIGGENISQLRSKVVAKYIAMLSQQPITPPGISVETLIAYGRAPHQNLLGLHTPQDQQHIEAALDFVSLNKLRHRLVSELSGGQRQRAFIAMCIAQDTPYMLFDEPTSFLDIHFQYEVLGLMKQLNNQGKTIVTVLHDIAQAARYADTLVVMKDGRLYAQGNPKDIVTPQMVLEVYGIDTLVYPDPVTGTPVVSPVTE